jgi:hypothetical protein
VTSARAVASAVRAGARFIASPGLSAEVVRACRRHRLLGVVGLELAVRAYPAGLPLRDRAHLELLGRLRGLLAPGVRWQAEAPVGVTGDQRAWDLLLISGIIRIGVDAETRTTDLQAVARRALLKRRDSGANGAILLLANSRWHRRLVREHEDWLRSAFPVDGRETLASLAAGRDPGGDALLLL